MRALRRSALAVPALRLRVLPALPQIVLRSLPGAARVPRGALMGMIVFDVLAGCVLLGIFVAIAVTGGDRWDGR